MNSAVLTRRLRVLGLAALCSNIGVPSVSADPLTVTSGFFISPEDSPPGFRFLGDGLVLSGFLPLVTTSPRVPCVTGCPPGTVVDMSTVAGGESALTPFTLGSSPGALINGTEFGDLSQFGNQLSLSGTLRFDAPVVVLPPPESFRPLTVPFVLNGHVTGFASDDLAAHVPLFHVALVGQGTAMLELLDFVDGSYREPYVTYTFAAAPAPVPEPATILLLGTGLAGVGMRRWRLRNQQ